MYQMTKYVPSVEVPESMDITEEIGMIVSDLALGDALRERAMFRLWRLYYTGQYTEIAADTDDALLPKYPTWTAFLADFCSAAGISRASVYSRVKTYAQLNWLGYSEQEMLEMMTRKPGLYERVLGRLISWDTANDMPKELKTDKLGDFDDIDDAKEPIMDLLDDLDAHDQIQDAIKYVDSAVLQKPYVDLSVQNGMFVLSYSEEESLAVKTNSAAENISFVPDSDAPQWVWEELQRRYKLSITQDEDYVP